MGQFPECAGITGWMRSDRMTPGHKKRAIG
jgi:hypothetical protein